MFDHNSNGYCPSSCVPVRLQGALQTNTLMKVDPASLAMGYRTSKGNGSIIVNEANEIVGTIDDLIVTPTRKGPLCGAVGRGLSGYGLEICRGAVQFAPSVKTKQMVLPGAAKDSLKALPEFKYNTGT